MFGLSYREQSICGSLVAQIIVAGGYFLDTWREIARGTIDAEAATGRAIGAVVLLVAVEIVYHGLISVHQRREPTDERDRLVAALANRNAYFVLQVGVWTVVGHILIGAAARATPLGPWFSSFATAQLLVLAAIFAETTKSVSQLFYYRRGS